MSIRRLAAAGAGLVLTLATLQSQSGAPQKPDYPIQPVPFTAVHLTDVFWAPRIEINRTASIPVGVRAVRAHRTGQAVRARGAVLRGEAHDDKRPPGYPVRRNRSLQSDRGRGVLAERHARSEARCLRRRPDREDRRGAGARRLHLHDAHDRSEEPAPVGRARALGPRARRQPRALRSRPPVRGRGRASSRHRQAHAARRRDQGRRPARRDVRSRQANDVARATRSPRWRS